MATDMMRAQTHTPAAPIARPETVLTGPMAHGLDATGAVLRIARIHVPLREVVSYSVDGLAEKDFASTFATAGFFGGGAAVFLVAVFVVQWSKRFLIGALLLSLIAIFALLDLKRIKWLTTYTFTLRLSDGTTHSFATNSQAEALRLRDALDAR